MKTTTKKIDLLEGDILKKLFLLSAPLMATTFVNMAYNMTDTAWLGRLGADAVAASGSAHFFIWIAFAIGGIARVGTSIFASQEYGAGNRNKLLDTIKNGTYLMTIITLIYTALMLIFARQIIGFYGLEDNVTEMGIIYLRIYSVGFLVSLLNSLFSSVYNGLGNSYFPFIANVVGLVMNIVLDPVLIFGLGPIPAMGMAGAAIASIFSQFVVFLIIIIDIIKSKNEIYDGLKNGHFNSSNMIEKFKKGFPVGAMSVFHALISMTLARFISGYGTIPVAVYSVGAQIESITWMTTEGFSGGIVAFVGQNYGAKKFDRLREIIKKSITAVAIIGIVGTFILVVFRYQLFRLFVPNSEETIQIGAKYLLILGSAQLFMGLEIGIGSVFNGLGHTKTPAIVSAICNLLRIPISIILMPNYMFYGVWASMAITMFLKGSSMIYFLALEYKNIVHGLNRV